MDSQNTTVRKILETESERMILNDGQRENGLTRNTYHIVVVTRKMHVKTRISRHYSSTWRVQLHTLLIRFATRVHTLYHRSTTFSYFVSSF